MTPRDSKNDQDRTPHIFCVQLPSSCDSILKRDRLLSITSVSETNMKRTTTKKEEENICKETSQMSKCNSSYQPPSNIQFNKVYLPQIISYKPTIHNPLNYNSQSSKLCILNNWLKRCAADWLILLMKAMKKRKNWKRKHNKMENQNK